MKRIAMVVAVNMAVAAPVAAVGADESSFGAIESRALWERPGDGLTLYQRAESALDRGTGRVEDEALFQLRLLDRERAIRGGRIERNGEVERYREEMERGEQLEQMRLRAAQAAERAKRYEREAEALAKERSAWRAVVERENAAGGAVVDREALERVEAEYRAAVAHAAKARDAALATAGDDREKIGAAAREFERARAEAMQRRTARREVILGHK